MQFTYQRATTLLGIGLFIGMMSVGYYYNLTFVQLGLIDLGERVIGMSQAAVALNMAFMALITCLVAIGFGIWMSQRACPERSVRKIGLVFKLRVAFLVVLAQTILTVLAPGLRSQEAFFTWIFAGSIALGLGVPVTFGMTVDLVPRRWRGEVAAIITAVAYLAANLLPASWSIQDFARPLLWIMPLGVIGLGVLAYLPLPFVKSLALQHHNPEFGVGRYSRVANRRLYILIILMFGVFFVDSLGFLRLLETPRFLESAWQSTDLNVRLLIGLVHVIAALVGGVLYDAFDIREMFYWIFGIFALTHLMYTFSIRASADSAPLIEPVLYATAVSLYTVVNFALWADLSTPRTIGRNAALGVALSGWTATFISTALAIWWEMSGMTIERHLNIVDSLAILFLLVIMIQALIPRRMSHLQRGKL